MFPYLGLKASTKQSQIDERLQYHPQVFEFFTTEQDVTPSGLIHLRDMIEYVKAAGVSKIVIHHPMKFQGIHNEVAVDQTSHRDGYHFLMRSSEALIKLAIETDTQVLIHGGYNSPLSEILSNYSSIEAARKVVFSRLDYFQSIGGDHVMFENSISPLYDYGDPKLENLVIEHQYRLCYDTSHGFIVLHGDNAKLQASMAHLHDQIVHYHFVDSMGKFHDSLELGKGAIDWSALKSVVNMSATNIFEINLKDQMNSQEMRNSYQYLKACWQTSV
ncbi:TIM barrel protein [Lentilactobacillus otakiensis]|uniref:TIM barrel protein n=1 Tax=Lentilactobacillus otakiensis TaxID=481720 RepID=UPI003D167E54